MFLGKKAITIRECILYDICLCEVVRIKSQWIHAQRFSDVTWKICTPFEKEDRNKRNERTYTISYGDEGMSYTHPKSAKNEAAYERWHQIIIVLRVFFTQS